MPSYRITTPEQVQFHYDVAGLVSRAMAWLIDQVLLWALRLAIFLVLFRFGMFGIAVLLVTIFLLDFGYYAYFELRSAGQSPGKQLMGLRVVSATGARLSFADVMIRNLLRAIDSLPLTMVVGGIVALIDRYHRRLGDLAADTLVVRDVKVQAPAALLASAARDNSFQNDPAIRSRILARTTREQRDLLYDLMFRRDELQPQVREQLFAQAATLLRQTYSLPDDMEHLSDEQTVLNVALVIQHARE